MWGKALNDFDKQLQSQADHNIKEAHENLKMEVETALLEHQVMLRRQDLMWCQKELPSMEEPHNQEGYK